MAGQFGCVPHKLSFPAGGLPLLVANRTEPAWVRRLLAWPGLVIAFLWGVAEGTLFFIVPDVSISLAAMFRARRALDQLGAAIVGAVVAGGVMFCWAATPGGAARSAVASVPFVSQSMFERVDHDFQRLGAWALFQGPRYGIPYKVYAVEAPRRMSLPSFLLVTVPARFERLIISWLLFSALGFGLRRAGLLRSAVAVGIHAALWVGFYAYYWTVV